MMMILVVGAIALGGFFLLQSSGGLAGLMGTPKEEAPVAPAPTEGEGEEAPKEGEGMEDDMSPYERYESRSPFGGSFKYEQRGGPFGPGPGPGFGGPPPYPVPIGYPRGPPPFGPRPHPPFGGPPAPPCAKWCFGPFASPPKCRQCKDAMGHKSYYSRGCSCGR